jgi:hypothetical protein
MYTLLDTVDILFKMFFVYVKIRDFFQVAELSGALCVPEFTHPATNFRHRSYNNT